MFLHLHSVVDLVDFSFSSESGMNNYTTLQNHLESIYYQHK